LRGALLLIALAATAHAEGRPHYGGGAEGTLLGEPATLDPVLATSHAEISVVELVCDTLYKVASDGSVHPRLATGVPSLDTAHTTAKLSVRKNVRFHDGSVLTAADVVASLERVRQKAPWVLAPVAAIKATGEHTIELTLHAPVADLTTLLALPQTSITKGGKPPTAALIGTGAWKIDALDRAGKRIVLHAFDDHFLGRPYLDKLVLDWFDTKEAEPKRFETGDIQLSARGATVFTGGKPKYPAVAVPSNPGVLLVFVGFGHAHAAITDDRTFRQALDSAIDRGSVAVITTGETTTPVRVPVPPEPSSRLEGAGLIGDAAAAKSLLAEAGKHNAELAKPIKLDIAIDQTRPDDRDIADRVVRGLDRLGISATITPLPAEQLRDRVQQGACDLYVGQLAMPANATDLWWAAAFAAGGDDWAQTHLASGPLDGAAAAKEFAARMPVVPLMFRQVLMWRRSDLRGLDFDAIARPELGDLYWIGRGKP
jgi:peptide/nickel transport system substrate-binding protein